MWSAVDLHHRRAVAGVIITAGLFALPFIIVIATRATSIRFLRQALDIPWFGLIPFPTFPHAVPIIRLARR